MGAHRKIKIGDAFENLQVIENLGLKKYCGKNCTFYKCKCLKCGNIIEVPIKNLGTAQKDCGCGKTEPRDIIPNGTMFGRLKVIGIGHHEKGKGYWYLCECGCNKRTVVEVHRRNLLQGYVTSCGCVHDELFKKNSKKAKKKMFVKGTAVPQAINDKIPKNNTSGVKGVSWHKKNRKWQVRIQFQGKLYHLGYYDDIETAKEVREKAKKEIQKDFWKWYSENFPDKK